MGNPQEASAPPLANFGMEPTQQANPPPPVYQSAQAAYPVLPQAAYVANGQTQPQGFQNNQPQGYPNQGVRSRCDIQRKWQVAGHTADT